MLHLTIDLLGNVVKQITQCQSLRTLGTCHANLEYRLKPLDEIFFRAINVDIFVLILWMWLGRYLVPEVGNEICI